MSSTCSHMSVINSLMSYFLMAKISTRVNHAVEFVSIAARHYKLLNVKESNHS